MDEEPWGEDSDCEEEEGEAEEYEYEDDANEEYDGMIMDDVGQALPRSTEQRSKPCKVCTFPNYATAASCTLCRSPLAASKSPDHSAAAAPPDCFTCLLCTRDFISASEGYYELQYCQHYFCRSCLVGHVGKCLSKLETAAVHGLAALICPMQGCAQKMTRQDVRLTAGFDVLQRLDKWVLEKVAEAFDQSGYLESFFSVVRMLHSAYDALMNVKVSVVKRPPKKKHRPIPRGGCGYEEDDDDAIEVVQEEGGAESVLLEMLRRLEEELQLGGDSLSYSMSVLLCSNPSIWNVLCGLVRNDSTMDITQRSELYLQVFSMFRAVSDKPELYSLLLSEGGGPEDDLWRDEVVKPGCLMSQFEKLHRQCSFLLGSFSEDAQLPANDVALLSEAKSLYEDLHLRVRMWKLRLSSFTWLADAEVYFQRKFPRVFERGDAEKQKGKVDQADESETEYLRALKAVQFGEAELLRGHYYRNQALQEKSNVARSRRISKEIAGLVTSLPLQLHSSIHVRVDKSRMDVLRALIIGPQDTPYENGIFLFDIYLESGYPNLPPKVHFLTTAGGTVRFNPNLYHCGKVCLSLLGTWEYGPGWKAGLSTVLQVLVSLQSLVFVSEPFYNEPGYEPGKHEKMSEEYNREQMYNTLVNSMLPALRQPEGVFEGVIEAHFRLKRRAIEQQCDAWSELEMPEEFSTRTNAVSLNTMKEAALAVKTALAARFGPAPSA